VFSLYLYPRLATPTQAKKQSNEVEKAEYIGIAISRRLRTKEGKVMMIIAGSQWCRRERVG
jgi:hypothetical protein